jgi:hypothetical protein
MNRCLSFGRDLATIPASPAHSARILIAIIEIFDPITENEALLGSLLCLLIVGLKAHSQLALGQKMYFVRRGQPT